jgi:methylaspartate ammonia-lyase
MKAYLLKFDIVDITGNDEPLILPIIADSDEAAVVRASQLKQHSVNHELISETNDVTIEPFTPDVVRFKDYADKGVEEITKALTKKYKPTDIIQVYDWSGNDTGLIHVRKCVESLIVIGSVQHLFGPERPSGNSK